MTGNTNQGLNEATTKFGTLKYRMYLARVRDEVDMENFAKAVNATVFAVPMVQGKTMHYLDCHIGTIVPNAAAAGTIAPQGTLTIAATIPGLSKKTLAWLYENTGEYFLVIWVNCQTGQKFIGGTPCGGLQLGYKNLGIQNNGEWQGAEIEFKGSQCPDPFNFFDGNIALEEPMTLVINNGKIGISTQSQYLIPNGTAAQTITEIIGVTDNDIGRIIDLQGGGSSFPATIAASATFIMQNGVDWVASYGSTISFQIAKVGADTYAFYEVARS